MSESTFRKTRLGFEESIRCHFGLTLRDVQVDAAARLLGRCIVEMQTGEGKTFTTGLAAAVHVRAGRNVMVATANEYLANRDACWLGPIYQDLGITAGSVCSSRAAYRAGVTYGTIRQFGFDFLRNGISARNRAGDSKRSRDNVILTKPFDVLIVDEADSVLIDEARTPMIITAPGGSLTVEQEAAYRWAAETSAVLQADFDFVDVDSGNGIALTPTARRRISRTQMPPQMNGLSTTEIFHALERALMVHNRLSRDHHYVLRDGRIDLVDEYTGRITARRTMANGIHQAIEAKEGLALTPPAVAIARVAVQDFVAKFNHVCGLTATAREDRRELEGVYGVTVRRVPTFRPVRRSLMPTIVCADQVQKWQRISAEVLELVSQGRAVLIGTRTVGQSESLSAVLDDQGIPHERLNALNPEQESKIIATAGQAGRVTVATNMAGRGTDIPLADEVRSRGGLHVIVSELHAARRIDRQLMGRCARQGDPGTTRAFVSADDEILELAFGSEHAREVRAKFLAGRSDRWLLRQLHRAQRHLSRLHRQQRIELTSHESRLAESMRILGLDPHFDPVPDDVL